MSIAAMIASIKFNDRRNKREAFSHISGSLDNESPGIKVEPVTDEVLQEIREKLKKQNRILSIKMTIAIAISLALTIALLFYFTSKF
ncbi:hypothetical protein [Aquimarina brevivitae]|uniref:Uncharacterized protein n=1 Tax=Aquimarina brevivitae TaxID=323412 RepID=A0A4Q7PJ25_9FLAO|nr:hypothetical protein [Aquimarina brevivitae]RZS98912.1 hypothetical protein EV197_0113 [Aquimarina brevivitae]